MPYLIRRAQENSAVADLSTHEANLLQAELRRRFTGASHA